MFKYLFKRDTLFATLAVFIVMGFFSFIPINTHFLDPIHLALSDFDYNDLAYAKMHKNENTPTDTNIVIVNVGQGNRQEIAAMIATIDSQSPKAIGVDILFNAKKDAAGDSLLSNQFSTNKKLIGAYNINAPSGRGYFYKQSANKGFANFVGQEEGVIRHFTPVEKKEQVPAFAVAVLKVADAKSYDELLKRKQITEIINYKRKADKYLIIDGMDLLAGKAVPSVFANKIVLLGYVSNGVNDVEDKHFTPMNEKYTGRALPDMNGVFIHANIISMAQDHDYIHRMPAWLMWSIAFLLCWLHMALFIKDYLDNHIWFHLLAKIAQIISAVFFVYLGLLFFHQFDTQMNMTATLAAIILAVDVLYFYEAFATWLHKKKGYKTIFTHKHD
jgi:CHASE2 domain-containing sensor protein